MLEVRPLSLVRKSWLPALLLCTALASCTEVNDHSPPAFTIEAIGAVQEESIEAIRTSLQSNMPRILTGLGLEELPQFVVKVWRDPNEFRSVYESGGGVGGVTEGYINTVSREVRVLENANVSQVAVHEFAHLAMLEINPTIAANPFWLWESVVLYLDGSGSPDTTKLTCITDQGMPTLAELNPQSSSIKVYRFGYLITEFILESWGQAGLLSLIQTNGDTEESIGIAQNQFERDLHEYLLKTYDFGSGDQPMKRSELLETFSGNTLVNAEFGQSTFMSADGTFSFRSNGVVALQGKWFASDRDQVCLDLGAAAPRCSSWYQESESVYLLESASDCVYQRWTLVQGN